MARYIKENGLVRAITTTNLNLEKPLTSDNYSIEVHNRNMDKIDTAIQEANGKIDGLELVASNVKMADGTTVEDTVTVNKTSILELEKTDGKLANLKTTNKTNLVAAINEVFQNANNGKDIIANAIGSPLVNSDTFSAMGTKIDALTQTFQNTLTEKGVEVLPSDKMSTLINKVGNIEVEKHNLPPNIKYLAAATELKSNSDMGGQWTTCELYNDKIYCLGIVRVRGYNKYRKSIYDIYSDTWTQYEDLTSPLSDSVHLNSSVLIEDTIYTIYSKFCSYDIKSDTSVELTKTADLAGTLKKPISIGTDIYYGSEEGLVRYDTITNTSTKLLQASIKSICVNRDNTRLYYTASSYGLGYYDLKTGESTSLPDMPSVTVNANIIFMGFLDDNSIGIGYQFLGLYVLDVNTCKHEYIFHTGLFNDNSSLINVSNDYFYLFGGGTYSSPKSDLVVTAILNNKGGNK